MRALTEDTATNLLKEQFIPDNLFIYVVNGALQVFDGDKNYVFKKGDALLARKNRLAKYELLEPNFEPILFCFDEPFLKEFQKKHAIQISSFKPKDAFLKIDKSNLINNFIQSVKPYYIGAMELEAAFEDLKYQELLIILLKLQPELANVLFDFAPQEKINLEAFMNKNYTFNVSVERFATLTGRSLSAFKRDFRAVFSDTPNHWLMQRRLQEAYFLLNKKNKKPSDIYIDLGFENLSHFSFAFKKEFGVSPRKVMG